MMRRRYFVRNKWRERVNTAFAQYWTATKTMQALSKTQDSQEKERVFRKTFDEMAAASRQVPAPNGMSALVWPAIFAGLDGEGKVTGEAGKGYITGPESSTLFRELVFLKYGITYRELMVELEKDKSKSNYRKLMLVHEDFHRLHTGTAGFDGLKLKFNKAHFQIMIQGLDLGLLDLNEWELAACFDEICPCAQRHSLEYLKKFRARVKRACEHILSSAQKPTTIEISGQVPSVEPNSPPIR
jgi:hypothetical protein